jgi:hypothetical protein
VSADHTRSPRQTGEQLVRGEARVHELAKEFGVTSKDVLAKLANMGEFVKSPSSTVGPAVARKLRAQYSSQAAAGPKRHTGPPPPRPTPMRASAQKRDETELRNAPDHHVRDQILGTWERIRKFVPVTTRNNAAWVAKETGVSRARVSFAESVRNWIAHPDGRHEPGTGTLNDALRVLGEVERELSP